MLEPTPKPFPIVSFVEAEVIVDGRAYPGVLPLSGISSEKLSEMCDEFRAKIFEKAGKKDPKIND